MTGYAKQEYADIHLMYGRADDLAQRMYQQQYLRRHRPFHSTFSTFNRLLRETGTFHTVRSYSGRLCNVRTLQIFETVQQRFADSQIEKNTSSCSWCTWWFGNCQDVPFPHPEGTTYNRKRLPPS
ncbi:hypothetical protein NPIL_671611 [Nephila pilipes]|uniref:Uncharacterized protein n=1 Tax=Nephila pilipes TaxID=299642 RepID=A0A8X6TP82_NEPPI|nr:hypothetical protein NPIL_671611 [Nephila pilipes]